MRIVVNGAGIAGPTIAYWLKASGHEVLLVEEAPRVRAGGYVIDFWGVGYDVAERMGLLPQISALGYPVREVRFVDRQRLWACGDRKRSVTGASGPAQLPTPEGVKTRTAGGMWRWGKASCRAWVLLLFTKSFERPAIFNSRSRE